jgi:ubiquinone/menaquinone biosynthesis C-methylase UbiE
VGVPSDHGLVQQDVVPRVVNFALAEKRTGEMRERVCAGLAGQVVELGFGSGLNAPHYPPAVTELLAVEPSDLAWRLAEPQRASTATAVRRVGLDGESLPLPDERADAALSTWTLCTIPDASRALAEVHRVLRPGGTLHFVEHGRSPHDGVRRWQQRFEPIQKRIAGGCHLSRPIDDLITGAGFTIEALSTYYAPKEPKPFAWFYEGVARKT